MLSVALFLSVFAQAGTLAGVTLPDTATVGGQALVLNGMGLREKYFIDIYVGGLYLQKRSTSASAAIEADEPKRLVMHFTYSSVTKQQLADSFDEGLAYQAGAAAVKARMAELNALLEDLVAGEQLAFDYVPGKGTTVSVKGRAKGTIAGADFMRALWGIYLGETPPTTKLKRGLLGT